MVGAAIEVQGLSQFRKDLRKLEAGQRWVRELGGEHRTIARSAAGWAQTEARSMGGPQRHFASALKGYGSATGARIGVARPEANAAFWGANQRTGWNAGNRSPNQPAWVTNSWDVASPGAGPYAINEVLFRRQDQIVDMFDEAVTRVVTASSAYITQTF